MGMASSSSVVIATMTTKTPLLDDLHLQVRLSLREIVALERGEIPQTLRDFVTDGLNKLETNYYGIRVAQAVSAERRSHANATRETKRRR